MRIARTLVAVISRYHHVPRVIVLAAVVLVLLLGLLSGPVGFDRGEQSAEAALLDEVKKLLSSDNEN